MVGPILPQKSLYVERKRKGGKKDGRVNEDYAHLFQLNTGGRDHERRNTGTSRSRKSQRNRCSLEPPKKQSFWTLDFNLMRLFSDTGTVKE